MKQTLKRVLEFVWLWKTFLQTLLCVFLQSILIKTYYINLFSTWHSSRSFLFYNESNAHQVSRSYHCTGNCHKFCRNFYISRSLVQKWIIIIAQCERNNGNSTIAFSFKSNGYLLPSFSLLLSKKLQWTIQSLTFAKKILLNNSYISILIRWQVKHGQELRFLSSCKFALSIIFKNYLIVNPINFCNLILVIIQQIIYEL